MLEVEGHLEAFHTVHVDSSKIDWSKSQSSQAAITSAMSSGGSCDTQKNFSCACGANFQFQDDLQVHQVRKIAKFLMCKVTISLSLSLSLSLFLQLTECTVGRVVVDNPLAVADLRPDDIVG